MSQYLLTPNERLLLKFQRKNVIVTTSSSSDSDHHKYDNVRLLDSKKHLVKLRQAIKINNVLKYYREKNELKEVDRNLFKGLFINRPNKKYEEADFTESAEDFHEGRPHSQRKQ